MRTTFWAWPIALGLMLVANWHLWRTIKAQRAIIAACDTAMRQHAQQIRLMLHPQPHFTCPRCGMTSFNPNDILYGWCGKCHAFTAPGKPVSERTT